MTEQQAEAGDLTLGDMISGQEQISRWRESGHPEKAGIPVQAQAQAPGTGAPMRIWDEIRADQDRIRVDITAMRDEVNVTFRKIHARLDLLAGREAGAGGIIAEDAGGGELEGPAASG